MEMLGQYDDGTPGGGGHQARFRLGGWLRPPLSEHEPPASTITITSVHRGSNGWPISQSFGHADYRGTDFVFDMAWTRARDGKGGDMPFAPHMMIDFATRPNERPVTTMMTSARLLTTATAAAASRPGGGYNGWYDPPLYPGCTIARSARIDSSVFHAAIDAFLRRPDDVRRILVHLHQLPVVLAAIIGEYELQTSVS
jgi:hypothetical protein